MTIENQRIRHLVKDEDLERLTQEASEMVQRLDTKESEQMDKIIEAFGDLGEKEQQQADETLEHLKRPVKDLMEEKNSDISTTLLDLRKQVEILNPTDLKTGGLKGLLYKITGKNPMSNYIRKYQSVETQIEEIVSSLLHGQDRLQEDTVGLTITKRRAQDKIYDLEKQIYLGKKLLEKIENDEKAGKFDDNKEGVLKATRKIAVRTYNMQQSVNVLEQSIISMELIIDNNDKLEEAIFNAITNTKNIITVSAAIQIALTNQKKVIAAVDAVNQAGEDMLVNNAKLLKQNTADINRQLEKPSISMEKLRQAFNDVYAAIEMTEESNKRIVQNSKKFISDMDKLNADMRKKIQGNGEKQ